MNEAVFKTTVMGGFNKSDVLAFIDKQDAQFKAREKDLAARIDALGAGLKNETQRTEQLTARVAELEKLLDEEKTKNEELTKELEEASVETGEVKKGLNDELSSRDEKIERLKGEVYQLRQISKDAEIKAANATRHSEETEEKLRLIDKTQDQIGRAMLEAQKTADNIMNAAKGEAAELLDKAKKDADELTENAEVHVRKINGEAQDKLNGLLLSAADYKNQVSEARREAERFFGSVDTAFASMNASAESILNKYKDIFNKPEETGEEAETPAQDEKAPKEAAAVKFDFSAADDDSIED